MACACGSMFATQRMGWTTSARASWRTCSAGRGSPILIFMVRTRRASVRAQCGPMATHSGTSVRGGALGRTRPRGRARSASTCCRYVREQLIASCVHSVSARLLAHALGCVLTGNDIHGQGMRALASALAGSCLTSLHVERSYMRARAGAHAKAALTAAAADVSTLCLHMLDFVDR